MLNRSLYWLMGVMLFLSAGLITTSCNKTFDAPPSFIEPDIQANITIKDLKARHTMGAIEQITEDLIVAGIVVADDKSGNFYKSIAIQDATGGITVRLDGSNLYTSYPVGRKVYIKLKGLYLGDYNKLYQIGGGVDDTDPSRPELAPLASGLFDTYIVKGSTGNTVTPKVVTLDQLHDSLQSTLIQINNMEFVPADTSKTYADAEGKVTKNLYVKACTGNSVILRTSGYSTFAGVNVPNGNGTLLSVYTVFGTTKQLMVRDTSDVRFTGPRCGAGPTAEMEIAAVRSLFKGSSVAVPDGSRISGVVISDRAANNQDDNNLVLQQADGKAGIMIRFVDPHTFDLGDKIEVNISLQSLEEYGGTAVANEGVLQLNGIPNDYAKKVGTGTITPREATSTEIAANFETWESTLVKVKSVTITGGTGGAWNGTTTLTDASGAVKAYTRSAATFSGTAYPTIVVQSVTGYLTQFKGTQQLTLRTLADVDAPAPPPPPVTSDFEATYDFALVTNTSGTTDPSTVPAVGGLTFGSFKAVGALSANSSGGGRFSFSGWPLGATTATDVFTGSLDPAKYYEVTITPEAGKQLDLTSLTFRLQRSGTGVRQAVVRASVDNFAANLPASINPANAALSVVPTNVFQITDATTSGVDGCTITFGTGFTNLTSPVTLRFYGLNAEASGGTFSIDDVKVVGKVH